MSISAAFWVVLFCFTGGWAKGDPTAQPGSPMEEKKQPTRRKGPNNRQGQERETGTGHLRPSWDDPMEDWLVQLYRSRDNQC